MISDESAARHMNGQNVNGSAPVADVELQQKAAVSDILTLIEKQPLDDVHGSALDEVRELVRLGWPSSVSMIMTFGPPLAMISHLGSLDAEYIAGAGMGFMYPASESRTRTLPMPRGKIMSSHLAAGTAMWPASRSSSA